LREAAELIVVVVEMKVGLFVVGDEEGMVGPIGF
jgi:hypothetical protein